MESWNDYVTNHTIYISDPTAAAAKEAAGQASGGAAKEAEGQESGGKDAAGQPFPITMAVLNAFCKELEAQMIKCVKKQGQSDVGHSYLSRRKETNLKSGKETVELAIKQAPKADIRLNLFGKVDFEQKVGALKVAEQFDTSFYVQAEFPDASGRNYPAWLVGKTAKAEECNVATHVHEHSFEWEFLNFGKKVKVQCTANFPYLTTESASLTKGTIIKRCESPLEVLRADPNAVKHRQKVNTQ